MRGVMVTTPRPLIAINGLYHAEDPMLRLRQRYVDKLLELMDTGFAAAELEELITKRISLEEAVKAFEYYDRGEWIKILVEPFRD